MNNNEWGNVLRIELGENIAVNDNVLKLTSPMPYVKTKSISENDGLVIGLTNKTVGGVNFIAGQYVEYTFLEGDIYMAGDWVARVFSTKTDLTKRKISTYPLIFTVDP